MATPSKEYLFPSKIATDNCYDNLPFPSDDINPKEKGTGFALAYAKAIYSYYLRGFTAIPYNGLDMIYENRAYGNGMQSPLRYQKQLFNLEDGQVPTDEQRKGMYNVNQEIISEIPKLKRIFLGLSDSTKYDLNISAIDEASGFEKETIKYKIYMESLLGIQDVQTSVSGQAKPILSSPTSIDELEVYKSTGGIKLPAEIAFSKALKAAFYDSNWDKDISVRVGEDIFENGIGAAKDYTDPITGRVKQRYVDIGMLIASYTYATNFNDMTFCGEFVYTNVKEVKRLTGMPDKELYKLAQMYQGWNGNPYIPQGYALSTFNSGYTNITEFDSYKITVMDVEFMSVNSTYYTDKKDKRGADRFFEEEYNVGLEKSKKKTKEIVKSQYYTVYSCKWIVGTDIVYDFDTVKDVPFDKEKKRPKLSYHVVKAPGKSMVMTLKPMTDLYQLNWLKLQNALAMAAPSGLAMDVEAIKNATSGGKLDMKDVIKLRMQHGYVPYKMTNTFGKPSGGMPYYPLEGGIGRYFDEIVRLFELFDKMKQDLTGFTEMAAAVTPSSDTGKGVSEMALGATSNALRPIFNCMVDLKEKIGRSTAERIQVIARNSKNGYNCYVPIIGSGGFEAIKVTADYALMEMGIMVRMKPNEQQKALAMQALQSALQSGKNGVPSISMADYFYISNLIEEGDVKEAQLWLAYKEGKSKMESEALSQQNIQLQNKGLAELETAKTQKEISVINAQADADIRVKYWENVFKQDVQINETEGKMLEAFQQQEIEREQQMMQNAPQTQAPQSQVA